MIQSEPGDRLPAVPGGAAITAATERMPSYLEVTRLVVGSFLPRYREPTLTAYTQDLQAFLGCCQAYDREPLRISRGELEMYVLHLESGATRRRRWPAGSARWPPSTGSPSSTA